MDIRRYADRHKEMAKLFRAAAPHQPEHMIQLYATQALCVLDDDVPAKPSNVTRFPTRPRLSVVECGSEERA